MASYQAHTAPLSVPAGVHQRLDGLARAHGVTLFMVVQAALAVLLARLGAGSDIPVGTPVAGRTDAALDELVGFFVNTLVLRTDTAGDPSFAGLLGRVRECWLGALDHQDVPFERLVELLAPARSMARHPLFQVMLELQNNAPATLQLDQVQVAELADGTRAVQFDLDIAVTEVAGERGRPAGLAGLVTVAADLFDAPAAAELAARFSQVLAVVAADPDLQLNRVNVLSAAEREVLLSWGRGGTPATAGGRVDRLIGARAAACPDAAAVVSGDRWVSYRELAARAARLARMLAGAGAGPESVVGLCLERGADLIAAMWGTWLAGAAYLPLDPGYPAQRLEYMLADSNAAVLVAHRSAARALAGPARAAGLTVLWLDAAGPADSAAETRTGPVSSVSPAGRGDLACVIYTSGSTGVPKGVLVTHQGLASVLAGWAAAHFAPADSHRWLTLASAGFDVFTGDVVRALGPGGSVVVGPVGLQLSVPQWAESLARNAVSALECAPRHADALVDYLHHAGTALPGLRLLVVTTEVWRSAAAARARLVLGPRVRVLTAYGLTEATVDSTWSDRPGLADGADRPVAVGRPLPGSRLLVLDERLGLRPGGVAGEVYLAGPGLARGYGGRPGLTAQRFVADPLGPAGGRLYRTGDVGRWSRDGELEYLGRADDQISIRGYRVEPGEIEAVLAAHPAIAQAVVTLREDVPGDQRLIAYIIPAAAGTAAGAGAGITAAVRGYAAARLPDYMVPAAVVPLGELPLTPAGKIDRSALPAPDYAAVAGLQVPASAREELLCGAFAHVLGLERAGATDSFFDLGGHSLLAVRLVSQIRTVLRVDVPLRLVFEAPTPAALAARLDQAGPARLALTPRPRPDRMPLSFAQQRLWFLAQVEGPSATYNLPIAVRLGGDLDTAALATALGDVIGRHEVLRTVFPAERGQPWQRVLGSGAAAPELPVSEVAEADLAGAVAGLATEPFDLQAEQPLRARLLRTGPAEHVLVVVLHHIAGDGWSMGILARDVSVAYAARHAKAEGQAGGREPDWDPLAVQYADYALWQRELLGDPGDPRSLQAAQAGYWRRMLAGAPAELALPATRPRPAVASHAGHGAALNVPAGVHAALAAVARARGVTMFMVVQAAVVVLLARLGAGTDVPVGTAVAGRTDAALDDLVGFFVNTLVLRTGLAGDPPFTVVLERVREAGLGALDHQDVPFERLVEILAPDRSLARHPLFQVMIEVDNNAAAELRLPGIQAEVLPADTSRARFDLEFVLAETIGAAGRPAGLSGLVTVAADLFDPASAAELAGRLARVLTAVAAGPALRVHQIPVLDAAERQQVVSGWNDTAAKVPGMQAGAGMLIAAQAARAPDAVAVACGRTCVSYGWLARRARVVAGLVAGAEPAAGPELVAGLCLERGAELIAAIWGCWLAGAGYLPLDPGYPVARLGFMLADSGASVLVARRGGVADELARRLAGRVAWLDDPAAGPQALASGLRGRGWCRRISSRT